MIFTKRADYGLRITLELASRHGQGALSARRIARWSELPEPFVKKLLQQLAVAGVARSVRGRHGGYTLTRRPEEIPLSDALEAFEELAPVSCLAYPHGRGREQGPESEGGAPCALELAEAECPTRAVWAFVDGRLRAALDAISLADLLKELRVRGLRLGDAHHG